MLGDLRAALRNGGLDVEFRPETDLRSGVVVGVGPGSLLVDQPATSPDQRDQGRSRSGRRSRVGGSLRPVDPLAIHHVSVNVSDPDESIAFYTDVLGGAVRGDRPDFGLGGAWIDLGATQVHLIAADVPPNHGQHFAILVADLDATIRELRSRGLDVEDGRVVGPDRQTFLTDPSGNLIELHQVGTHTS